mgnify:CR=1 FL=1
MKETIEKIEELIRSFYQIKVNQEKIDYTRIPLAAPIYDSKEAIRGIRTILNGWISQGENVKKFENDFANYIGCYFGIAVNSGSSANLLALLALKEKYNLQDGDEVIIPAATFATVAMPVIQAGFVPLYVDVSRVTLNIDPKQIEKAISSKTKIIMPVHTLGYPAEIEKIIEIAKKHQLLIIEDCCEAHGSSINGKKVGSFSDIATFSFFVAHNMTTGEGGMIVTNDLELESLCKSQREFGRISYETDNNERFFTDKILKEYDKRYVFTRLGYNVRMTDVLAAFGIEQLKKLDNMNLKRRENAVWLKKKINSLLKDYFVVPCEESGYYHTYYTFPITLKNNTRFTRNELAKYLESKGIETRPLFAGCLPDQPAFRNAPGRTIGNLDNARYLRDKLIFIGIHPKLEEGHLQYILDTILFFVKNNI